MTTTSDVQAGIRGFRTWATAVSDGSQNVTFHLESNHV
jgi:hypothetical protein